MKQLYCILMLNGLFFSILIHSFDFVDSSLDAFIQRLVPTEDHHAFKLYYEEFINSLKKLTPTKKKTELQRIRELARCGLEIKHPDWAQQLKPYAFYERDEKASPEKESKSIRMFLTRYAAYEDYCKDKALERAGMWHRFRSYSKHVTTKFANWFGFNQSHQKIT